MQTIERAGGTNLAARELDLPDVVLEITRGRARQKNRAVRGAAFLIGSSADCDLVLGDPRFEAVHSYVFVTPRQVTIRQVSLAGPRLCVAGRDVSWASLLDFDQLQMGPYEFHIRIQWPQGQPQDAEPAVGRRLELSRPPLVDDPVPERLLQAVEYYSNVPQLSLFVGDGQCETEPRPAQGTAKQGPPQARHRQAGY